MASKKRQVEFKRVAPRPDPTQRVEFTRVSTTTPIRGTTNQQPRQFFFTRRAPERSRVEFVTFTGTTRAVPPPQPATQPPAQFESSVPQPSPPATFSDQMQASKELANDGEEVPVGRPNEQRFRASIYAHANYGGRKSPSDAPEVYIEMVGTLEEIEEAKQTAAAYLQERYFKRASSVGEADLTQVSDRQSRAIAAEGFLSGKAHPTANRELRRVLGKALPHVF